MCYQVMIVEDDPMVAAINKKYTETVPGFRVVGIFRNGAEGLEYLRENHVDLVILDYYMPQMNGDVFMDRIREAAAPRKETPPELPPMEQMEMAALTGTDPELPPEWRHTDG